MPSKRALVAPVEPLMDEAQDNLEHFVNTGGAGGRHPDPWPLKVLVGPATGKEFNTIRPALAPVACVLLKDSRFEFDSSFISPRATTQLQFLARLRAERPGIVASIFGHADPVGSDDYNKQLSGRRAQAVYGMLTRRTELWEELFSQPLGGDKWGDGALRTMLATLGHSAGPDEDLHGAVKEFQTDAGLAPDGTAGPATRKRLFKDYMDAVCVDPDSNPFSLDPKTDFLARGADKNGKGDYQGCGEFNPVLIFSQAQKAEFDQATDKSRRNDANRPNRRVMLFLFREGLKLAPDNWPCPSVKEGVAGCRKRFFSDAKSRLANGEAPREYRLTKDTCACRFYDRFARVSPCETGPETTLKCHISLLLRSNSGCVPLAKRKYKLTISEQRVLEGTTDEDGLVQHGDIPPGDYKLEIEEHKTFVPAIPVFRTRREHQVEGFMLFADNTVPPTVETFATAPEPNDVTSSLEPPPPDKSPQFA